LRLSYAGQCLRVRGSQIAPDRQVGQTGIELIGHDSPEADAEIVLVAAEALAAVGLNRISFDLTLPMLAQTLMDEAGITGSERAALARALDRKDAAEVAVHGGVLAPVLTELLLSSGSADHALATLRAAVPARAGGRAGGALATRLADAVAAIRTRNPSLRLTIDPVEFRGFRYENGVSVSIFAPGRHELLGRGGRYVCGDTEPATGITLFPDAILRVAPKREPRKRVFIPVVASQARAAALRREGYATVAALAAAPDELAEASRMGCTHVLRNGTVQLLPPESHTGD
jgi:ATP phosphoribosyltransferase regulatory subunit